jgi:hypothetical protein
VEGERHGKGVYTYANGNRYEGGYVEGKRHGKGVHTLPDGTMHEGDYVEGEPQGKSLGACAGTDGTTREGGDVAR